ncbi:hypothetical protein BJ912DRAFT_424450 [Pholiota molesta]|nr:hypothetical protein BJ912DRAFT_424450 [Pholiota molesta]
MWFSLLSALRKPNAQRQHYPRERPCDPKIRTLFRDRSALTACLGRQRLTCGGAVHNAELTSRTSSPAYRDHSDEQNVLAGDPDDIAAHRARVDTQIVRISRDRGPWAPQRAAHRHTGRAATTLPRSALAAWLGRQRLTRERAGHSGGATSMNAGLSGSASRAAYRDHGDERNVPAGDPDDIGAHRARVDNQIVRIVFWSMGTTGRRSHTARAARNSE